MMEIIIKDFNDFEYHRYGVEVSLELQEILKDIKISTRKNPKQFEKAFRYGLDINGFPNEIKIHINHNNTITSIKNNVGVSKSLGNIANGFYDLTKLNYYSTLKSNFAGILICHIKPGENKTNFKRITEEIEDMYSNFITFPLQVIGINQ